jgi:hypothetical protein
MRRENTIQDQYVEKSGSIYPQGWIFTDHLRRESGFRVIRKRRIVNDSAQGPVGEAAPGLRAIAGR